MADQTLFHSLILGKRDVAVPFSQYKSLSGVCGIYAFINAASGKIYIGSSKDIGCRVRKHVESLRRGKHRNRYLQFSFQKNGEDSFSVICAEKCSEGELLTREQAWMDGTNCADERVGYNIMPRADRKFFSAETRRRLSEAHLGHRHTEEAKRKIGAASKGNKYRLGVKNSDKERARVKLFMSTRHPMKGKFGPLNPLFGRKRSPEFVAAARERAKKNAHRIARQFFKPVFQLDRKTGEVISRFESVKAAAIAVGGGRTQIGEVCRGSKVHKTAKGFKWCWAYETNPSEIPDAATASPVQGNATEVDRLPFGEA